jgi:hypothetical protein
MRAIDIPQHFIPEPNTGCHLWLGRVDKDGYPVTDQPGLKHRPCRYMCEGLQPEEHALHHCDVRSCINPEHLYRGDVAQNMADKMRRGRWKGGRKPKGVNPDALWRGHYSKKVF